MKLFTLNITSLYVTGPFRLLIIFWLLTVLYFGFTTKNNKQLKHLVVGHTQVLAVSLVVSFILIQINAFDRFSIFLLIFCVILWKALKFNRTVPILEQLNHKKENLIRSWIRMVETEKYPSIHLGRYFSKNFIKEKIKSFGHQRVLMWCLLGIITSLAYVSRSYLYDFDRYTLSDLWQQDLMLLKSIDHHEWFSTQNFVLGEYVMIALYKQLTNISWIEALLSFGLIESALMSGIIFWYISKITRTVIFPGVVGSFAFIFLYGFLVLDIGTIAQHKPIFFALLLFLPASAIMLNPTQYSHSPKNIFKKLFWLFIGISLCSIFVPLIIIPSFIVGTFLWFPRAKRKFLVAAVLSFLLATASVMTIYAIATAFYGGSFGVFITSNLYEVSSYTFLPQLLLPYPNFLVLLQIVAAVILISNVILWSYNRTKWFPLLAFHTFFCILLLLSYFENQYFDREMLNQVMAVCLPVFLATTLFTVYTVVVMSIFYKLSLNIYHKPTLVLVFLLLLFIFQKNSLNQVPLGNNFAQGTVQAYLKLEAQYLPYSYAVVNTMQLAPVSSGSHYFITYEAFNQNYLQRDAIYARYKDDQAYLKQHPEQILPNSTFIFLYKVDKNQATQEDSFSGERKEIQKNLAKLKQRKRTVNLFYSGPHLRVYEVVNEPGGGKITNLLLNKYKDREGLY